MSEGVPDVLFVCVRNAGRSQMAAHLLDHLARGRVRVRSAGSTPADEVHENVRLVMREIGIDLSLELPKALTDETVVSADIVITMGCGDTCPVYPGKRYIDWEVSDPAEATIDEARAIRNEIERRVKDLLGQLGVNVLPSHAGEIGSGSRQPRSGFPAEP